MCNLRIYILEATRKSQWFSHTIRFYGFFPFYLFSTFILSWTTFISYSLLVAFEWSHSIFPFNVRMKYRGQLAHVYNIYISVTYVYTCISIKSSSLRDFSITYIIYMETRTRHLSFNRAWSRIITQNYMYRTQLRHYCKYSIFILSDQ